MCHDLRAFDVRLTFVFPAEPHEGSAQSELGSLRDNRSDIAADDRSEHLSGNCADLVFRGLARLGRAVSEDDVTQFVSHDAGDLAFVLCGFDHSPVDVHRSTRKREGVDFADVHKLECVLELRMAQFRGDDVDEPTTNIPNVARQQFVAENWQLLFRLGRSLPS